MVYVFNNAGDWDVVGSIIETAWGSTISEEGEIGNTRERGQLASSVLPLSPFTVPFQLDFVLFTCLQSSC